MMTDLISRADAIDVVHKYFVEALDNEPHETDEDGYDVFTDMKSVNALLYHNKYVSKALKALPSAEANPTVVRCKTMIPYGDFREWAKRIREDNPNVIVIPFDAEVASADAVQGEWIHDGKNFKGGLDWCHCSVCGQKTSTNGLSMYNFCPNCGARMKGGDDE